MKKKKTKSWKNIVNIGSIFALVLFVYFLRDQIWDTFSNLKNLNLYFILIMPLMQVFNYHAYASMYQQLLGYLGIKVRYRDMYRAALELNFINNIFPSGGVSGVSFFSLRLKKYGVEASKSTLVQLFKFVLIYLSFQFLLLFGLIILAIGGKANNFLILIAGSLTTLLFVGTSLFIYIMGSVVRIHGFVNVFVVGINNTVKHIFRRKTFKIDPEKVSKYLEQLHIDFKVFKQDYRKLYKPLGYAFLANLTELGTIYVVYMAFGQFVNPGAIIISYAIANFSGLFSVMPGSVGLYEALMTGVLAAAGISPTISIPITITYRILNLLIQLPLGGTYYYHSLHSKEQLKT